MITWINIIRGAYLVYFDPVMILYNMLKIVIGLGIKLYYREIRVQHKERVNTQGPAIIIANHPNTLMDAWIIGSISKNPIYYMTKGTYFNKPIKRWLLKSIGLIPINRAIDGVTEGVSNTDSFEQCYKILEEGKTLVIFPEGNSVQERNLRILKSGAARIALETEKRNEGSLGLKIIPIGIVYLRGHKFRSSVFMKVGAYIDPISYLKEFKTDSIKGAKSLTEQFRIHLERCLVNSESVDQEQLVDDIVDILTVRLSNNENKGVEQDVELIKNVHERLNAIWLTSPWKIEEIEQLVYKIKWQIQKLAIKTDFLSNQQKIGSFLTQLAQSILFLLIGLPLFLFGAIHSIVPFKTTSFAMPRLIRSIEYYAPIAVLLGLVLYPLNYFIFLVIIGKFIDLPVWAEIVYLLLMPITGMYAYYFVQYMSHVAFKWNFLFAMMTEKESLNALLVERERLNKIIFVE